MVWIHPSLIALAVGGCGCRDSGGGKEIGGGIVGYHIYSRCYWY